jgi:hypothetical protein
MGNIRVSKPINGETMNGNGHTTLIEVKALIESVLDGVVDMNGQIHIEDAVSVLQEELDEPTIQEILKLTGKEDLTEVMMMFI